MTALAQLLAASGAGIIISAIVAGVFSRRKLGADAAKIITDAAAGVVVTMQHEVDRVRAEMVAMKTDHRRDMEHIHDEHRKEMRDVQDWARLHVAWDALAITELGKLGISLPEPPPPLQMD